MPPSIVVSGLTFEFGEIRCQSIIAGARGLNDVRDIGGAGTGIPDRNLIVKYSYLFDVFR
jgi:hypothetical protein